MAMTFEQKQQQAFDAGGFMRVFNKPRSDVPMFEMGEEGRQLRLKWLAGWDQADSRIREYRKTQNSGGVQ